ncbi:C6 transcription factor [Penicillium cinerascens]|uniref:C6 transcription factor n=1 Tax=Penicillium cinerascens TaxID=70096 RepID=A0A9W9JCX3_9EURO|nr:C6 transcription factor [Penicillium cinerascens]KAJ5194744.1 C6 transcription factor [Penicillium cinerascens]
MVPRQVKPTTEVSHSSGERKSVPDKVHPKGYVEILERQQIWLVRGLRELYRRSIESGIWPGDPLELEDNGHPLTHDLLARLGVIDHNKDLRFEEDSQSLCSRDPDDPSDSPSLLQSRSSSSLGSSVHQNKSTASLTSEPMSAGWEDNIKPQPVNDGLGFTPRSVKGADSSPTSLDVRQQTSEPMSAGLENNIKPQPGNDGLGFTPLPVKGAASSPTSLDVRPHREQQWVGGDLDALFHESDLLISADQTCFTLDDFITAASSSETPIPLINAPSVPLHEPVIDPQSSLNFDLASFGAPPGFWKTYAF